METSKNVLEEELIDVDVERGTKRIKFNNSIRIPVYIDLYNLVFVEKNCEAEKIQKIFVENKITYEEFCKIFKDFYTQSKTLNKMQNLERLILSAFNKNMKTYNFSDCEKELMQMFNKHKNNELLSFIVEKVNNLKDVLNNVVDSIYYEHMENVIDALKKRKEYREEISELLENILIEKKEFKHNVVLLYVCIKCYAKTDDCWLEKYHSEFLLVRNDYFLKELFTLEKFDFTPHCAALLKIFYEREQLDEISAKVLTKVDYEKLDAEEASRIKECCVINGINYVLYDIHKSIGLIHDVILSVHEKLFEVYDDKEFEKIEAFLHENDRKNFKKVGDTYFISNISIMDLYLDNITCLETNKHNDYSFYFNKYVLRHINAECLSELSFVKLIYYVTVKNNELWKEWIKTNKTGLRKKFKRILNMWKSKKYTKALEMFE